MDANACSNKLGVEEVTTGTDGQNAEQTPKIDDKMQAQLQCLQNNQHKLKRNNSVPPGSDIHVQEEPPKGVVGTCFDEQKAGNGLAHGSDKVDATNEVSTVKDEVQSYLSQPLANENKNHQKMTIILVLVTYIEKTMASLLANSNYHEKVIKF